MGCGVSKSEKNPEDEVPERFAATQVAMNGMKVIHVQHVVL